MTAFGVAHLARRPDIVRIMRLWKDCYEVVVKRRSHRNRISKTRKCDGAVYTKPYQVQPTSQWAS